ncbi:MAG: MogA/MoaB family molybdenum cofactor biosynthesis protein [Candidatus Bathyarchaeia archaeon]
MSEVSFKHKMVAPSKVNVMVITCSSSRYKIKKETGRIDDPSGDLIVNILSEKGHKILDRKLIPDNKLMIKNTLKKALKKKDLDAIVITGGTGISKKDLTIEVAKKIVEKDLPGFGELLRKISYEKIGSAAMLTRAFAGIAKNKAIFCIPGSPNAVEIALKELIMPEILHIVKHIKE